MDLFFVLVHSLVLETCFLDFAGHSLVLFVGFVDAIEKVEQLDLDPGVSQMVVDVAQQEVLLAIVSGLVQRFH